MKVGAGQSAWDALPSSVKSAREGTRPTMTRFGPEPWRVAQVLTDFENHAGELGTRVGSGYLVNGNQVLTAAHVLSPPGDRSVSVTVALDVDQPGEVRCVVAPQDCWVDVQADLALIPVSLPPARASGALPISFGRLRSDELAVVAVDALGFPAFTLRARGISGAGAATLRELEHLVGHVAVVSDRRQGTLAINLAQPSPRDSAPVADDESPWAGMSGAAVWAGGHIVGIVTDHYRAGGSGRLTGRRIERSLNTMSPSDRGEFFRRLRLAGDATTLVDVTSERSSAALADYARQVAETAPTELVGRSSELETLTTFTAGHEPYCWIQGDPWSGKTALVSWFVTHPPAGLNVVSFFVTRRRAEQSNSGAFLSATLDQLRSLVSPRYPTAETPAARDGQWLRLLDHAAAQSRSTGHRLILVIDGLDEDDAGASPRDGLPSIASLLPRHIPDNLRVIVTSRKHPGLPDDVPEDHPLRRVRAQTLAPADIGIDLERLASSELHRLLTDSDQYARIVGYMAAAISGLTASDLSDLTGERPYQLRKFFHGIRGRSVTTASVSGGMRHSSPSAGSDVYLFAHDTLRVLAEEQLGQSMDGFRHDIRRWIDGYRSRGWPPDTPEYAVVGYSRMLGVTGQLSTLSALAADSSRHEFLCQRTGSDYAALQEIRRATELVAVADVPDLSTALELSLWRQSLSTRVTNIPARLVSLWARLDRVDHAESLAGSISNPEHQARALAGIVGALCGRGDMARAEGVLQAVEVDAFRAEASVALVRALAAHGDTVAAQSLATTVGSDEDRAEACGAVAEILVARGESATAADWLAHTITSDKHRAIILARLAMASAGGCEADAPSRLLRSARACITALRDHRDVAWATTHLSQALWGTGEREAALRGLAEVERRALLIENLGRRAWQEALLVQALASMNEFERARSVAERIQSPWHCDQARTVLVQSLARSGRLDEAEKLAGVIGLPEQRAFALAAVADGCAAAGLVERGVEVTNTIDVPVRRIEALIELADRCRAVMRPAQASTLLSRARTACSEVGSRRQRARLLARLVRASFDGGDASAADGVLVEAWDVARSVRSPVTRSSSLVTLAEELAEAGEPALATTVLEEAEKIARSLMDPAQQAWALREKIDALIRIDEYEAALQLTRMLADADQQARSAVSLARRLVEASRHTEALGIADVCPDAEARDAVLHELTKALVVKGDVAAAEASASRILNPQVRAQAETALLRCLAMTGDRKGAEDRAAALPDPHDRARAVATVAAAMADIGRFTDARECAEGIAAPAIRDQALNLLAQRLVIAGQLSDAQEAAQCIHDERIAARALTAIAEGLAASGQLEEAEVASSSIGNVSHRDRCRASIAGVAARAGHAELAERWALGIAERPVQDAALIDLVSAVSGYDPTSGERIGRALEDPSARASALVACGKAAHAAGRREEGLAMLREARDAGSHIQPNRQRGRTMSSVAVAFAVMTSSAEARRTADLISDAEQEKRCRVDIAAELEQQGLWDEAIACVLSVSGARQRDQALGRLGELFAERGRADLSRQCLARVTSAQVANATRSALVALFAAQSLTDEAQMLAEEISEAEARARGLVAVAVAKARSGARSDAETILARTGALWDLPLDAVAEVAPETLRRSVPTIIACTQLFLDSVDVVPLG